MKTIKLLSLIIVLFGVAMSGSIWARGGHGGHHFGGGGYYGNYGGLYSGYSRYGYGHGRFFLSPYYAYHPRVVEVPTEPPVYIQRQDIELATGLQTNYWHYCNNSKGYYPHVKKCPNGWLLVAPRPSKE